MKRKLYSFLLMMGTLLGLTSCEWNGDSYESMTLSGQWQGDFGMYYEYEYRGRWYRHDSYDTDIEFIPRHEYASYGYGYQVDWYRTGPYRYLNYYFEWRVVNGVIRIHYPGNEEWDTEIYDYSLSEFSFRGYFSSGNDRFTLKKIRDFYDWSPYYGYEFGWGYNDGWDYYPFGGYCWSRSSGSEEPDSTQNQVGIRRGNRFLEK